MESGILVRTIFITEIFRKGELGKSQIELEIFSEIGRIAESMNVGMRMFYWDMEISQSEEPTNYR